MLDHITIPVRDLAKSRDFYSQALAPLGYKLLFQAPAETAGTTGACGFGIAPKPDYWIYGVGSSGRAVAGMHIAIKATRRSEVDAFYQAAIKAGGIDNGAPGLRPHYHANYYGAFVLDPDGYNIEAVCRAPE